MSITLVKLAIETAPFLGGAGDSDGAVAVRDLLDRYREAARNDAAHAAADEREARDRLFVAEEHRVQANRAALEAPARHARARVQDQRRAMEDASVRGTDASRDLAYAVERSSRPDRTRCLRPDLGAHALRGFASARLRELDEIAAPLTPLRLERHAVLIDAMRRRFTDMAGVVRS